MIIFLYGPDAFQAKEKIAELKKKFLEKNNGQNVLASAINGGEFNLSEFRNKVLSSGFFAEKKMIIISYELLITNYELQILEIVKKVPEEVILVIWDKSGDNKFLKSDLGKYLLEQKYVFEFNPLSGNALVSWIRESAKNYGCEIDNETIALICDIFGNDLWKIDLELSKLCAYANSILRDCRAQSTGLAMTDGENVSPVPSLRGGVADEAIPSITKKMANELLAKEAEDNVFKFVDALAAKNKRLALLVFEEELRASASELAILGAVAAQIRNLLQTKSLLEKTPYNKNDLAKKLNIHPFVAQKSLAQVKNFQFNELKNIYRELLKIDMAIKTSAAPAKAMFGRLIARI